METKEPVEPDVYFAAHLASNRNVEAFECLEPGVSTAQDVKEIDPYVELNFFLSSGIRSYSLLNQEETKLQVKEKKICSHLKLDSYDVGIPLLKSMSDIMNLLQKHGISVETSSENLIIIKSKILSLDIDFYISLQFENESIRIVSMSPDGYLEGRDLYVRYKKVQQALERVLGRPQNIIQVIVNRLNPNARSFGWCINGIRIKHYLQDRFGMEEIISIDFSKSKLGKLAQISDEILRCVELEQKRINSGESSKWNPGVLQDIVYPEVKELLEHALDGEIFFRYGKKQRLLESTYFMTDTLENLSDTPLGEKISELQRIMNSL